MQKWWKFIILKILLSSSNANWNIGVEALSGWRSTVVEITTCIRHISLDFLFSLGRRRTYISSLYPLTESLQLIVTFSKHKICTNIRLFTSFSSVFYSDLIIQIMCNFSLETFLLSFVDLAVLYTLVLIDSNWRPK